MQWKDIDRGLVESGLARIHRHLAAGQSLGILSAMKNDRDQRGNEAAHRRLIRRLRQHGYGPIEATGRSQWGIEQSLVVPNARLADMTRLGDEFAQQAIIYLPAGGKKDASMHWLAASDKAGTVELLGPEHFNVPNATGITILRGLGYNPHDEDTPTRSFTFGHAKEKDGKWIIESLMVPPGGQLNPLAKPYV